MGNVALGWATQLLVWLLREGDGTALLGDLAEERARRARSSSASDAAQWYRHQLYASLTAVLRWRLLEWVRAVPWGTTAAAYLVVGLLELGSVWLLSWLWPGVAHQTSALRLVMEFPGIVAIAYVTAKVHRHSPLLLGGMMLVVAVLMLTLSPEVVTRAFAIAMLTVGPGGAVLGWLLHRRWSAVVPALALLVVAGSAQAQEAVADPPKTSYGEMSSRAPRELGAFAFLIGRWDGTGRTRLPDGKVVEYPLTWIGRYILDGTAIADEVHGTARDGSRAVALTFRQFDGASKTWVIELLGLPDSRFFRQVHQGSGSVTVSGRNVTVISDGASGRIREHYLVADDDRWVYRLDESGDSGKSWNEGRTEYILQRSKKD
jgi:hypothetical protein